MRNSKKWRQAHTLERSHLQSEGCGVLPTQPTHCFRAASGSCSFPSTLGPPPWSNGPPRCWKKPPGQENRGYLEDSWNMLEEEDPEGKNKHREQPQLSEEVLSPYYEESLPGASFLLGTILIHFINVPRVSGEIKGARKDSYPRMEILLLGWGGMSEIGNVDEEERLSWWKCWPCISHLKLIQHCGLPNWN